MMLADNTADQQAKSLQPPQCGCSIYVYADGGPFGHFLPLSITIDDVLLGWITQQRGYYMFWLTPGAHTLSAASDKHESSAFAEVSCTQRSLHFAHVVGDVAEGWDNTDYNFVFDSQEHAKQALNGRQLALTVDRTALAAEVE